jgi:purine-cytosine permease-like protein
MKILNKFGKEDIHDYSLSVVPESHRTLHWGSVSNVLIGISTAMFFLALGGKLINSYGGITTIIALIITTAVIGTSGFLFAKLGANHGLSSDLLSREPYGKYISALITFGNGLSHNIFFALELSIMLSALNSMMPDIQYADVIEYIILGIYMGILGFLGVRILSIIMWLSLPVYFIGIIALFLYAPHVSSISFSDWIFSSKGLTPSGGAFNLTSLLGALGSTLAIISISSYCADHGRMLKSTDRKIGSLVIGYGMPIAAFIITTVLGSYIALALGMENPGKYFPKYIGLLGIIVIFITQSRMNIVNMYSSALGYANVMQLIGIKATIWTRFICSLITVILGLLAIALGVFQSMLVVLSYLGIAIISWIMTMISYYFICYRCKIVNQPEININRLDNFAPIGGGAIILSIALTIIAKLGFLGDFVEQFSPIIDIVFSLFLPPTLMAFQKVTMHRSGSSAH